MKIISIEGNIGSGKSTFMKKLKENNKDKRVLFLDEPVEEWNTIKDIDGKNIIEKYYSNQEKYAFSFQMMAYISRLTLLKRAFESKKYEIIITERSLYTDKNVFCKMLYDDGLINLIEYKIYNKWFDEFTDLLQNIHYVYLKTEPNIANERILKRSRKGETIDIKYLFRCNDYHNNWLKKEKRVIVIDANKENDEKNIKLWIDMVEKLITE